MKLSERETWYYSFKRKPENLFTNKTILGFYKQNWLIRRLKGRNSEEKLTKAHYFKSFIFNINSCGLYFPLYDFWYFFIFMQNVYAYTMYITYTFKNESGQILRPILKLKTYLKCPAIAHKTGLLSNNMSPIFQNLQLEVS